MIIVSQDKKQVINFNTIDFIDIMPMDDGRFEVDANFAHCITELGYYDTEERAKEVLEEIIKTYIESKKAQETTSMFGFSVIPSNTYYEMPKE